MHYASGFGFYTLWWYLVPCVMILTLPTLDTHAQSHQRPFTFFLQKVINADIGWKTVDRMRWKWVFVWMWGRQKEGSRRGVTSESCTWISLQARTFGRLKCARAHTRANALSLAACGVAGIVMPRERPTGRQTFLSASRKRDPRTFVLLPLHSLNKIILLAKDSSLFLKPGGLKTCECFPIHKGIFISVYIWIHHKLCCDPNTPHLNIWIYTSTLLQN